MKDLSYAQFLHLSPRKKQQWAADLLRFLYLEKNPTWQRYTIVEEWLHLSTLDLTCNEEICKRYHYHLEKAGVTVKEHHFLPKVRRSDSPSESPFLPIAIVLENLRSAFNVGSILRTTEAFRLGQLFITPHTPFTDSHKVLKTALGAENFVSCFPCPDFATLPKPIIALETVENAPPIQDFQFPRSFTLLLGNEETGLSAHALSQADAFIHIPMFGYKNSLNVGCAFAIVASYVRSQHPS
jgi:tRNA G18 (ribose-2'-O)-methylase SpoU